MRRFQRPIEIALLLGTALAIMGCDEARLRDGGELTQTPVVQPASMRALVTAKGLESLYQTATPTGLTVHAEVLAHSASGYDLVVGPLEQTVQVERWGVTTGPGSMNVRAVLQRPSLTLALRIHDGISTQICRFGFTLDNAIIEARVEMISSDEGPVLGVSEEATIEVERVQVRRVGSCPLELGEPLGEDSNLGELLEDYVLTALLRSAEDAFAASPLDMMGLIRRRVELARVSPFESRRGHILVIGQLSESESSEVSTQGLEVSLDMALSARRAGCAPPVGLDIPDTRAASRVTAASLNQFGADVGFALSVPLLERLAQSMASAGFMCQGFDDGRRDEESREVMDIDSLRLGDIGLGGLSLGPWARLVLGTAELPTVQTRPERNDVQLRLPGFTIELYGEIFGVPVRLAEVKTTVDFGVRPRAGAAGLIGFEIESVQVREVELVSDWLVDYPANSDLLNWTRRLLLMTLRDRLVLPLPIDPGTPLTLVGSQIRSTDVVLLMKFAP